MGNIGYRISRYIGRGTKVFENKSTGNNITDNRIKDTGIKGIRKPLNISSRESKTKHTNKEDVLAQEEVAGVRE